MSTAKSCERRNAKSPSRDVEICVAGSEKKTAPKRWCVIIAAMLATTSYAQMYRPAPAPGGIDGVPKIVSIRKTNATAQMSWHGPPGPYTVITTPTLGPQTWSSIANITCRAYDNSIILSNLAGNQGYFTLQMPPNSYVGPGGCAGCHGDKYDQWRLTGHATAYNAIANLPPAVRKDCVVCHTVGYGQPSGFTDITSTPHLANVACENCHGPSAAHKYGDHALVHPVVTVAAEVCGGCHTSADHPTFNEWTNSPHVEVVAHVQEYFLDRDPIVGLQRQMSCGPCHSGATRVAMLNDGRRRAGVTNVAGGVTNIIAGVTNYLVLPSATDAAAYGQTCVTCHDAHRNEYDAQLRNPKFSTNFFTMPTAYVQTNVVTTNIIGQVTTNVFFLNTVFATNYNPSVQVCGQCHNTRGADWTSSGRPPHRSPQYNTLVGAVQPGYLNGTNVSQVIGSRFGRELTAIGPHGLNTNGCVQCHMNSTRVATPTDLNPNYTGHEFNVRLAGCTASACHTSTNQAGGFMVGLQGETTANSAALVGLLGQWATNKAPTITNAFGAYGKYAWEYTSAGLLSNPTGTNTFVGTTNIIAGPPSALQNRIPNTIKQARFDLYMVTHDGSLGVHNPEYVRYLMNHGISNVTYQLSQP